MIPTQRLGRGLLAGASALALALLPAGLAPVTAAAAPSDVTTGDGSGPAPVDLDATRAFSDTFRLDPALDTDPLYGLNVGLDARQSPPAGQHGISYTRVSGRWDTSVAPDQWFVQTSHPDHPNKLLFAKGVSAVMLGAPAVADDSGHYTVSTVIDPVVGDTGGSDWGSIVLSRSHRSNGYVTGSDVDLGLTVTSGGKLALFHGGSGETPFWTGTVAPTAQYAVSLAVSTGADRAVTLTVNGTPFTVSAPAGVTRWPGSEFLYLGAYLSSGDRVTTFGDGAGHGLDVSRIDTTATRSAKPFVDTFDGAPNATADFGLNRDLSARQPSLVSANYSAVSGVKGLAVDPPAGSVQVNSPAHPNVLSFPKGTSAVRLNRPATSDVPTGAYTVHAVLTPVVGSTPSADSAAGQDWASLAVSNASGGTGAVDAEDVAIGLRVQADGGLTLFQGGTPTALAAVPPNAVPTAARPAGSYEVSLTLATGDRQQATVKVDGATVFSGRTAAQLPRDGYVSLGAHHSAAGQVTTVDDLRVTMLGGLGYYGFFDIRDPNSPNYGANHAPEVAQWTNFNNYLRDQDRRLEFLDQCLPGSCVIDLNQETVVPRSPNDWQVNPNPNAAQNLLDLVQRIGSNIDKIGAVDMTDEAYSHGLSADQVMTQAQQIRAAFPDKLLIMSLDRWNAEQTAPIPSTVDIVGFDYYCKGRHEVQWRLDHLKTFLSSPDQHLMLFPESTNQTGIADNCFPDRTDTDVAAFNAEYRGIAAQDPRVVYLQNFRWLGPDQPAKVPLTAAAQKRIGAAVVNATPTPVPASVGVYRPSDGSFGEAAHNGWYTGQNVFGGGGNAVPLTGHWNGPGTDTVGVYHPDTATFQLSNDNATVAATFPFGIPGDVPLVGDWSGQGRTAVGVYRPGEQVFYLSDDNVTVKYRIKLGNAGWKPLVGDWDGNGTTTVAVYDPQTQTFYLNDSNQTEHPRPGVRFGNPGDVPVKGDWDGTGKETIGVYRPGDQTFYGAAENSDLVIYSKQFGNPGDVPLVGNWG
ncbi:hypothetical protein BX285_6748 [Streptomyces sp. 1114.5]|uniref:hypothetical protein n=1 Tax=Streptomyces sp. 1114.5 TaxID=1938830 RepID=UPI000EB1AB1C|nr:hypothetical protein [Streptomyces sp. 1114.5]RKT09648.1 hypothetical protein BX285_6748 [Streptomyces sp. 1114.5]